MRFVKDGTLQKKFFRILLIFLFSVILSNISWAQGDDDPGGDPDANVPIDGGVVVLIAAGVGYGVKKRAEAKQRKENQNTLITKEFTEKIKN